MKTKSRKSTSAKAKTNKTKAKTARVAENPQKNACLKMILGGASPSECHKKLGVRRGFARRLLKAELKKLGKPYTPTARIKDGKAITVEGKAKAPKRVPGQKSESITDRIPKSVPHRFTVKAIESNGNPGWGVFDTITGQEVEGGRARFINRENCDERARVADWMVTMGEKKIAALISNPSIERHELLLAKAVQAIAFPVKAKPETKPESKPKPVTAKSKPKQVKRKAA